MGWLRDSCVWCAFSTGMIEILMLQYQLLALCGTCNSRSNGCIHYHGLEHKNFFDVSNLMFKTNKDPEKSSQLHLRLDC